MMGTNLFNEKKYKLPTYIKLCYKDSNLKVSLTLTNKINVIKDSSGTGKSKTLFDIFKGVQTNNPNIIIDSAYKLRFVRVEDFDNPQIFQNKDTIFILDEDFNNIITDSRFNNIIKNEGAIFLIVSREFFNTGYVNLNAVSEMCIQENVMYNKSFFPYTELLKLDKSGNYDLIITEDKGSGNEFFNKYFNRDCISAGGRNNLCRVLKNYANIKVLLIADAAQLGGNIQELLNVIKINNLKVDFFLP